MIWDAGRGRAWAWVASWAVVVSAALGGCRSKGTPAEPKVAPEPVMMIPQPSTGFQVRYGDEIIVAGRLYRIGTPVVTWMDVGGYDAYRVERRFVPWEESHWGPTTRAIAEGRSDLSPSSPNRYNLRYQRTATERYTPSELEQIRGGGWSLELLQKHVDQFVIHYDVCGVSRQCFRVLHDLRGLSVHFMLDIDGTIYQTLDLKERAWHAGKANDRSIGIEIANMGSYSLRESIAPLMEWYKKDASGQTYIQIPARLGGESAVRTRGVTFRPARNDMVVGQIHGITQRMYDLTPQQYDALIKLTAALCDIFPQIQPDAPRDENGQVIMTVLSDEQFQNFKGVLGHFHVTREKVDPGVAFQWEYVLESARQLLAARKARTTGTDVSP
ncbi:MAG: N-acetylmuramoyl-L-alanine amidase [Tepidisphaerales bacterium]